MAFNACVESQVKGAKIVSMVHILDAADFWDSTDLPFLKEQLRDLTASSLPEDGCALPRTGFLALSCFYPVVMQR